MTPEIALVWPELKAAGPYPPAAYAFVQDGLRHTCDRLVEHDRESLGMGRHVSGQELCMGIRDLAIDRFGDLARTVLDVWNIRRTNDFGNIVFALVDAGLLRKTDEDAIEDFADVFDFDEAFSPTMSAI
jgi:uncharacterized repeat protein (TIGR04138 family)